MAKPESSVVVLPLTRAQATEIVRDVAKSDRWSVHIGYPPNHEWRKIANRRQIERCLSDGYVLDERATLDDHGNWRFRIARVCAGLDVVIEVALQRVQSLPRLYVLRIEGDQI